MKNIILTVAILTLAGCDEGISKSTASNATPASADGKGVKRDNTEVNVRDRTDAVKTPIDQNQNVKIITQDGKVTLRGPVKSADEKTQIEKLAHEVAGAANVDNQLEVQP
jgi:hyperosmotically inducible protein